MSIQLKRSLTSNIDKEYVLKQGQIGIDMPSTTNTRTKPYRAKIGDGTTTWENLPYLGDNSWVSIYDLGYGDGKDLGEIMNNLPSYVKGVKFPAGEYGYGQNRSLTIDIPCYFEPGATYISGLGATYFNKEVIAGRYQIFISNPFLDNSIDIYLNGSTYAYPEWCGWFPGTAVGSDTASNVFRLSGAVLFGKGEYSVSSKLTLSHYNTQIVGLSKYLTTLSVSELAANNMAMTSMMFQDITIIRPYVTGTGSCKNISIINCKWDADTQTRAFVDTFNIEQMIIDNTEITANPNIEDVLFDFYHLKSGNVVKMTNSSYMCTSGNHNMRGFGVSSDTVAQQLSISNCSFSDCANVYFSTSLASGETPVIQLLNCVLSNCLSFGAANRIARTSYLNCYATISSHNINASRVTNCTITWWDSTKTGVYGNSDGTFVNCQFDLTNTDQTNQIAGRYHECAFSPSTLPNPTSPSAQFLSCNCNLTSSDLGSHTLQFNTPLGSNLTPKYQS